MEAHKLRIFGLLLWWKHINWGYL